MFWGSELKYINYNSLNLQNSLSLVFNLVNNESFYQAIFYPIIK
jgi:hypothetical protein